MKAKVSFQFTINITDKGIHLSNKSINHTNMPKQSISQINITPITYII